MSTQTFFDTGLITQILYLNISPDQHLEQKHTDAGSQWSRGLDFVTAFPGFVRLYWGRSLEEPEKVQVHLGEPTAPSPATFSKCCSGGRVQDLRHVVLMLCFDHTVWENSQRSKLFLTSDTYTNDFLSIAKGLTGGEAPKIRHTTLHHQALGNPFGSSLLGHPIGTAIYTGTDEAWQYAWPLWTHIVRYVDGCRGIAGGRVLEPVDGLENGYAVYVGWQTVKQHDDYHHTQHFRDRWIVLQTGCQGYVEYGHVVFVETREGGGKTSKI